MSAPDLKDKVIVVTGGAGFLGSFIVEKLREKGAKKIFVPRSKDYNLIEKEAVVRLLKDQRPDYIIHAAGSVGGIGANQVNPGKFLYENLMMGSQLIESCRHVPVEKLLILGTICSYPKFCPVPFKEEDLWNGYPEETNAPYGIAKKLLLVQAQTYREQYGLNSIYLMPVNMYGPRDNFDPHTSHVIPAIIRKCIQAKKQGDNKIICWGDGSPTREFFYAEDAAEGIVLGLLHYNGKEPVNLGTGQEISIRQVTEMIVKMTGFQGDIEWDDSKPNGQPRRCVDISRAEHFFGFKAKTALADGLKNTIDWYLKTQS
ncbi:MAG: GDP-L-fucose synthase [Candidatus Omnitrophica bacterium]|nr:GDP-L-fucose synthase [Candidatus Omnitrophota bacterium]